MTITMSFQTVLAQEITDATDQTTECDGEEIILENTDIDSDITSEAYAASDSKLTTYSPASIYVGMTYMSGNKWSRKITLLDQYGNNYDGNVAFILYYENDKYTEYVDGGYTVDANGNLQQVPFTGDYGVTVDPETRTIIIDDTAQSDSVKGDYFLGIIDQDDVNPVTGGLKVVSLLVIRITVIRSYMTTWVNFYVNGGTCDTEDGTYVKDEENGNLVGTYEKGKEYGTLPTPTREGCDFDGWYTQSGERVDVDSIVLVEHLYAHWTCQGHIWNTDYTIDKESTCTEDGSKSIHCSVCNEIQEGSEKVIQATGHIWDNGTITTQPTCTEAAIKTFKCTINGCDGTKTEEVPAMGHLWNTFYTVDIKPTNKEAGSQSIHCSVCNEIQEGSEISVPILTGSWKKDSTGWWYSYSNGSYAKNEIVTIDGLQYGFNTSGYMITGWASFDGSWYYFNSSGAMVTGWKQISGKWYYMNEEGIMQTGWFDDGTNTFYLNSDGSMVTGWKQIGKTWYYFNSSGAMQTGWIRLSGTWYYLNEDGEMVVGKQTIEGDEYYFTSSGAMVTGWQSINGKWYYYNASGIKQASKWIGNYYVDSDGIMVTCCYVHNDPYYYWVNNSGVYEAQWTVTTRPDDTKYTIVEG